MFRFKISSTKFWVLLFSVMLAGQGLFAQKIKKMVIAGPFASVSHPLAYMVENKVLADIAEEVIFQTWKNPDDMRAMVVNGQVDFVAMPTNVAANLYNKGVKLKLLNVSIWGILNMVSRGNNLTSLKDFQGKKVVVPFRSDMPDIVFRALLKKQGVNPQKDMDIVYMSNPMDAMQMLILRRVDHALLAEPAISMALRKTKSFPMRVIAPDLYRSVNLQKEWGRVFQRQPRIPQAGIAVVDEKDSHVTKRFYQEYQKAVDWYVKNPQEAGKLTEKYFPMLKAQAVTDSIPFVNIQNIKASTAKKELEFFFNILLEDMPQSVGGKLPNERFYY